MADLIMMQPATTQWGHYLNALMRWYKRLDDIYKPRKKLDYDYGEDISWAFFLFCYHLKDWLIQDSSVKIPRNEIETFISNSVPLSICADLANGGKHLGLTRVRSQARNIKINGSMNLTMKGGTKPSSKAHYSQRIEVDGKVYDALELAKDCLMDWQKYLKSRSLLKQDLV